MAWTRKLPSGKYVGKYRDADGVERTAPDGPFTHKVAAERAAGAAEQRSRRIGWRSPDAAKQTWGEWCEVWWPTRDVAANTAKTDAGRRDNHLRPKWGDIPLGAITKHDIRVWAAEVREGRSDATVQRIVSLLRASLTAAVDAGVLDYNPAARLKLGGGQATHDRYLTHEEYAAIREHLDGHHATMADLLVNTGMRWSEAAALHHARVDREREVVWVAEVWSHTTRSIKAYPKGTKPRQVPLPEWVELPARPANVRTCGYRHDGSRCRGPLAVVTPAGELVSAWSFRWAWDQACAAAEVGHVRPHDLRHTYASWLLQDGVPLAVVRELLGHKSAKTTDRYAHLAELPRSAVLDALRRPLPEPPRAANVQQPDPKPGQTGLRVIKGGRSG